MTREKDLELLRLSDPLKLADLKESFRYLALEHHPDVGGDRDIFEAIHQAYKRLLKDAEIEDAKCPGCLGVGRVQLGATSFVPVMQICKHCNGSGKR